MTRECKMPGCTRDAGEQEGDDYRRGRFCSVECDVTYDKRRADARDARRADIEDARADGGL